MATMPLNTLWSSAIFLLTYVEMSHQTVWRTGISISSKSLDPLQGVIEKTCGSVSGLTQRQRMFCLARSQLMDPINQGASLGQEECHRRMSGRRWNCPKDNTVLLKAALVKGYMESAFLQAIQSSGVVQALARVCSSGKVSKHCGCDSTYRNYGKEQRDKFQQRSAKLRSAGESDKGNQVDMDLDGDIIKAVPLTEKDQSWSWGGCGDNWEAGMRYAAEFLDAGTITNRTTDRYGGMFGKSPVVNRMALHNNKAGRLAVKRLLDIRCRCMGLSGSCSDKVCWRVLPSIQRVGERLKKKFSVAVKVRLDEKSRTGLLVLPEDGTGLAAAGRRPPSKELVYSETSPSFCNANQLKASPGTKGRRCKPWSKGEDNCERLCCGRGYTTEEKRVEERCRCTFHWCCRVTCDRCVSTQEIHTCN